MQKRKGLKMTERRVRLGAVAAVMIVTAVLLADLPHASANVQQRVPSAADVKVDNFSFGPATITVAAGTTVTWTNHDDVPHNVVSTDKAFKSKVLDTGEQFSSTFSEPGVFPYFCSLHPKMTGKVVVQ